MKNNITGKIITTTDPNYTCAKMIEILQAKLTPEELCVLSLMWDDGRLEHVVEYLNETVLVEKYPEVFNGTDNTVEAEASEEEENRALDTLACGHVVCLRITK